MGIAILIRHIHIESASTVHDDVIKWKHFPRYWPLCGEFTGHRRIPLTKASDTDLMFSFICASINAWVNNREAGDSRRHRDVIIMINSPGSPRIISTNKRGYTLSCLLWFDQYHHNTAQLSNDLQGSYKMWVKLCFPNIYISVYLYTNWLSIYRTVISAAPYIICNSITAGHIPVNQTAQKQYIILQIT